MNPTNPKAVGGGGCTPGRRVGGDTEEGAKKWMAKLTAALHGANPAPVVTYSDSQDASSPPVRLALTIAEFSSSAGDGGAPPLLLLEHPAAGGARA